MDVACEPLKCTQTIEYYIFATTAEGKELLWPVTAPKLNQTVVVMPDF